MQEHLGPEAGAAPPDTPRRANARFMLRHPAHLIALGFGSGLSPKAPGTVGTLWAWVAFLVIDRWFDTLGASGFVGWPLLLLASAVVGQWACTTTARHMAVADPGAIVWDEVLAFWLVLWLIGAGGTGGSAGLWLQAAAFGLFRFFDAVKPGPVRWADQAFKQRPGEAIGHRQGFGILFDDLVAALCSLMVLAVALRLLRFWFPA